MQKFLKEFQIFLQKYQNIATKMATEFVRSPKIRRLRDILFVGNPMYSEVSSKEDAHIEILRHLPNPKKIDGEFVKHSETEAAQQSGSEREDNRRQI